MPGLSSTLSIAKTALSAQQFGLNVTGNNIANVNNTDYSVQTADHTNNTPISYGGYLLGTGVNVQQVEQSVNQLLENRLTDEKSSLAAYEEAESYMRILEGIFDENSDSSLTAMLNDYWNSWHDLADNPLGAPERVLVYEQGNKLAERFNTIGNDLDELQTELTTEIESGITDINSLTSRIAALNLEILSGETGNTANDLRDQRNALIDDLGELINLDVITQGSGSVIINVANGATLVNGSSSYQLAQKDEKVVWLGSSGSGYDITSDISGGKLSGWLDMRDEIIPKYKAEVNELAREMIWAMNYQQSQGVGLTYYNGSLTGDFAVDDGGWLTSFAFGDKIDNTKDTTVWIEDTSSATTEYRKIMMDMGVSQASLSNWQGTAPGASQSRYDLTVIDEGYVGDKIVTESSGDRLAEIWNTTGGGASTALDNILAEQTITIYDSPTGTHEIEIKDVGGDAKRSAASIAEALNNIGGVEAFASPNAVEFDISGITNAQDGDTVKYTLYVDGILHEQTFVVDSAAGILSQQFEDSLVSAVQTVNKLNGDTDLYADGLKITSDKGATLGIQDFEVQDNVGIQLNNFSNFNNTDTVTLTVTTDGVPTTSKDISVDLRGVNDVTDQAQMSAAFYRDLSAGLDTDTFTVEHDSVANTVTIRTLDGSNITLRNAGNDSGDDATIALTALAGSSTSGVGNTTLDFNAGATDVETFNSNTTAGDNILFSVPSVGTAGLAGTTSMITESTFTGATATTAAAIMGSVTVLMDDGMSLRSDSLSNLGLFGSSGVATTGSSIITLGGEGGFGSFSAGETVTFNVDGTNTVSFTIPTAAGSTTESALANQLFAELNLDITSSDYTFVQNGKSVSIIKAAGLEDPIAITGFSETGSNDATLSVSTGAGSGTNQPENSTLESGNTYRDFATSTLYDNEAVIYWAKKDANGYLTGESGLVTIEDDGTAAIVEGGGADTDL